MSRARALTRRLRMLGTLHEAVSALRALSAHHFRAARQALAAARAYREEVETTMAAAAFLPPPNDRGAPPAILVVAADLGLCGDFSSRIVEAALVARRELAAERVYCAGRRAVARLARAGVVPDRTYAAAASIAGLPQLLLPLVDDVIRDRRDGLLGSLHLVTARFEGAGHFAAVRMRVLPAAPAAIATPVQPSPYGNAAHLATVLTREFLYVTLHESLLDALAAEHGKRLTVAESARAWLEERIEANRRLRAAVERETSTQEIIEVAAGARLVHCAEEAGR
jgi:F0F1-type ATP synthase gamma subunit